LKRFVREEIAGPLGADIQIGARPADDHRIAEVVPPPPMDIPLDALPADHPMRKTFTSPPPDTESAEAANTIAWRRADIGSVNGHGNARSLVRALSPISLGGKANAKANGKASSKSDAGAVRLLSPETIELIFAEQSNGVDQVLGAPLRWGMGFGLPQPQTFPYLPDEKICFWGGWGGSMVVMDPGRRTTFAYAMNKMGQGTTGSERTQRYARLIYQALG
jgi:CubicO group peptidase (beta-lactamase class C family)